MQLDPPAAADTAVAEAAAEAAEVVDQTVLEQLINGDIRWALFDWLDEHGSEVAGSLLFLVVAFIVAKTIARIASAPVRRRVDETVGRFVNKLIYYGIMVCALLGVLSMLGVEVTSFAAVIAAAGFAIGLAFQNTLSNFASGVLMLVFRPFKVGDTINAAGITAKVIEIGLFTTVFDTFDNRRIIVPNNAIASGTIENISHHTERRIEVAVGVDYKADIDQTREVLAAAAESLGQYMIPGEGRGYQIVLGDLGDSSVKWTVRLWAAAADYGTAKQELTAAVKNHLDQADIGIPYPTMDVNVQQAG